MIIQDIRKQPVQAFDLAANGFKFIELPPKQRVDSSSTEETIRETYYPELEALAKSLYAPLRHSRGLSGNMMVRLTTMTGPALP